jgi:hypothetical protein
MCLARQSWTMHRICEQSTSASIAPAVGRPAPPIRDRSGARRDRRPRPRAPACGRESERARPQQQSARRRPVGRASEERGAGDQRLEGRGAAGTAGGRAMGKRCAIVGPACRGQLGAVLIRIKLSPKSRGQRVLRGGGGESAGAKHGRETRRGVGLQRTQQEEKAGTERKTRKGFPHESSRKARNTRSPVARRRACSAKPNPSRRGRCGNRCCLHARSPPRSALTGGCRPIRPAAVRLAPPLAFRRPSPPPAQP